MAWQQLSCAEQQLLQVARNELVVSWAPAACRHSPRHLAVLLLCAVQLEALIQRLSQIFSPEYALAEQRRVVVHPAVAWFVCSQLGASCLQTLSATAGCAAALRTWSQPFTAFLKSPVLSMQQHQAAFRRTLHQLDKLRLRPVQAVSGLVPVCAQGWRLPSAALWLSVLLSAAHCRAAAQPAVSEACLRSADVQLPASTPCCGQLCCCPSL